MWLCGNAVRLDGIGERAVLGERELQAVEVCLEVGLIVAATIGVALVEGQADLAGVGR